MNLLLFLVIWAIIWYIPITPKRFRLLSASRIISLTIGLLIFLTGIFWQLPLSIFVYLLIFSRLIVAFIEWSVSIRPATYEETQRYYMPGMNSNIKLSFKHKRKILAAIFIGALFISGCGLTVYGQVQTIANAEYFNSLIQTSTDLPFNTTIPDNMVRLVTEELATSIARRHMSEFGSNTQVLDCHVTKSSEGKLVWVATIGSTNIIAENYVKGFVIVDATDPTATPTIVHNEFYVGEGLWFDRNIPFRNYFADMAKSYGVAYLTWDPTTNTPTYVVTRYEVGFDFVNRYITPLGYDSEGNLQYEPATSANIPAWMTQIYDEYWLEGMIDQMGSLKRDSGFDYWAGGLLWFIAPSRDRFQMTEDTRYIVDPETNDVIALVCVNPVGNKHTLSGVFKATREGIEFYDFAQANYISGTTAEDLVEGRLPKPATGNYYATMPLLYTVETTAGNYRLAWYVPIYWSEGTGEEDETIYLAGFAIMDASDTNKIAVLINQEGITSEQLVRETRQSYINLFGVTTNIEFNATVLAKYDYVLDGTSHIVLNLDNSTYPWVEVTPTDLSTAQWNELLATTVGNNVMIRIEKQNDVWTITYFKNNSLS